ncbi:DUF1104 domain-containing protein [Helicobacter himalayensis]|uniref:DUF1104 domain-containing protein n=1 Tax=Helicobacter himalayensis TaxID=1591088 RepID=UPI0009EE4381|nr:DUF1104 domain-containing protein [Helicobacter himalayensis]
MKVQGLTMAVLASVFALGVAYGADYSKKSESELIKLNGTLKKIEDAVDLKLEIKKRIAKMDDKQKPEFVKKLKESYEENTAEMKVKDLRKLERETKEAFAKRIQKLSDAEKKELGLNKEAHSCHMHGDDEHKHKHHKH